MSHDRFLIIDDLVYHVGASIKDLGKKVGLSVKPKTPADALYPYMDLLDLVLVMTVEPGFGGQSFMADMLPKIEALASYIEEHHLNCELEVDGGIDTLPEVLCFAKVTADRLSGHYAKSEKTEGDHYGFLSCFNGKPDR